jgi:hypothetical protein
MLQPESLSRLQPVEIYTPCLESIFFTRPVLEKVDFQRHFPGWQVRGGGGVIKIKRGWNKEKSNCETKEFSLRILFLFLSFSLPLSATFIYFLFCFCVKLLPWCFNIKQANNKKYLGYSSSCVWSDSRRRGRVCVFRTDWSLHRICVRPVLYKHNLSLNGHLRLSRQTLLNSSADASRLVIQLHCLLYINYEAPSVV